MEPTNYHKLWENEDISLKTSHQVSEGMVLLNEESDISSEPLYSIERAKLDEVVVIRGYIKISP